MNPLTSVGFGFFVGMTIGYALKILGRILFFVLGIFFLGLLILQYFEAVQVQWLGIQAIYHALIDLIWNGGKTLIEFASTQPVLSTGLVAGLLFVLRKK